MVLTYPSYYLMSRVGQNPIHTVYIRYFWLGNHQIYGHIRCMYTVLANPSNVCYSQPLNTLSYHAHTDHAPMATFRGAPLTHEVAEDMLIGWMDPGRGSSPFSWLVAAGKNPVRGSAAATKMCGLSRRIMVPA